MNVTFRAFARRSACFTSITVFMSTSLSAESATVISWASSGDMPERDSAR